MQPQFYVAGFGLLLLSMVSLPATVMLAQGSAAACPVAGIVIKGKNAQGDYTSTTKGADPTDSSICVRVSEGPGAGVLHGKEAKSIYGWYNLTARDISEKTREAIRKNFAPVLAGQVNETSFDATFSMPGKGAPWTNSQVWVRTGQTSLTIDGHSVNVVTYHYSEKGGGGSNYEGEWDLWYDPVRHLFLKGEVRAPGGPVRGGFTITSVAP